MPKLRRRLKRMLAGWIGDSWTFDVRERTFRCQQEFFYNAFKALAFNGISGDYAEFGCHSGTTFGLAWRERQRHRHSASFWAFDSFQGLPPQADSADEHPMWVAGNMATSVDDFHRACRRNGIPASAYRAVPGYFQDTLASATAELPSDLALAYIDCDLWSSACCVLEFLRPRLKHGMILAFDDYFCWSASQLSGERRAVREFFPDSGPWRLHPFVQYGWHGQSFVVESAAL